ncbi:RelA/SpoT domain-containing protein [Paenibacillus apis]|uniref:GTP pyrophosphokinase n=1 Tax=Paenibacillus apis TaxID=1792174 RepID=A0A920CMN9_9BACL|nr:RelA/SpoT domain-containing protein [Paenibacillus apis]GIO42282.1 GTP pyrophosphokinase [Paenibacillus apis]
MITISKDEFFEKYHIPEESKEIVNWDQLNEIHTHFLSIRESLTTQADFIANTLRVNGKIHTVRSRVKDPEHLIAKIIRKVPQRREQKEKDFCFTVDNYQDEITDLIGVRAIHIFKDEWEEIHNYINKTWKTTEIIANVRAGDDTSRFEELGIPVDPRETGYRSVHYLIESSPTSKKIVAEIQVRTIFEEGYGEIDHILRYPHGDVPQVLALNLLLLNRIVGSSDEMASYINLLKESLRQIQNDYQNAISKKNEEIESLQEKINKMEMKEQDRSSLLSSIGVIKESNTSTYKLPSTQTIRALSLSDLINNQATEFKAGTILTGNLSRYLEEKSGDD